ncbi:uncharacterized protein Z519_10675 [Cladophialophora bantiana CBS 173.52]|uniref:Uncharacterized protein n=1 Tax=Cladophialophora bantiana (strain ATCC 10958 / CBS 173.52 / CDC B-1940 / NIH 8579) TaxID=1442370 RepID=A0A0D2HVP0_CLAB1|nr:uncharacterized protein Z519_10675 [Cladophialophora bantiana CBS 173.52]KIW88629.1 hypothetical protein Z519_10675 [Cladophialophora bantiana CBS 173.52]
MASKQHAPTTMNTIDLTAQMEALGVSCWDFAYPTGRCSLPPVKNCCFTTDVKAASRKAARGEHRSKHQERLVSNGAIATEAIVSDGQQADHQGDEGRYSSTKSRPQYQQQQQQHHHHHHHHHHHYHHNKSHKSANKHQQRSVSNTEQRTYLLSCPTVASIIYPQTHTTISSLLLTPHTQLVFLVPQSNILCPKVCELMHLPRAGGSGLRILPVPPEIEMRIVCESDGEGSGNGGCDAQAISIADVLAVDEVVAKVLKNTPATAFDGYIAFEDDRAAWTFLRRVGRGVKCAGAPKKI